MSFSWKPEALTCPKPQGQISRVVSGKGVRPRERATSETAQSPVHPNIQCRHPQGASQPRGVRWTHPPGLGPFSCGSRPSLTSRSKPFSRKMGPKVWKSSDLEQQGLGEEQHNVLTELERATLSEAAPG